MRIFSFCGSHVKIARRRETIKGDGNKTAELDP